MKIIPHLSLRTLLCAIAILLSGNAVYGSHIVGADLYYTHVSGNTYQIYVALYGDCGSTTGSYQTLPAASPQVCIYDGPTLVANITLSRPSPVCGTEITPLCPDDTSQCTNLSYATPGINKFLCTGFYTFPHTSTTWRLVYTANNGGSSYSWSCPGTLGTGTSSPSSSGRTSAITNIASAGSTMLQLIDTLNNSISANSSPDLTVSQQTFFCNSQHDEYDPMAIDPESDSMVFSLVPATNGSGGCGTVGGAVSYSGTAWPGMPVSANEPLQVLADSFLMDPATGKLIFHPNMFQRAVVVYNIREFRSGVLVGTSQREMTVLVVDCSVIFPCMLLPRPLRVQPFEKESDISVYPNPATDELNIKMDAHVYQTYCITNAVGQVFIQGKLSSSKYSLSIKSLPAGLYYIAFGGGNGSSVQKFVKQ